MDVQEAAELQTSIHGAGATNHLRTGFVRGWKAAVEETPERIEAVAKAIHDDEFHQGAWDDYDTWQINTEQMHESYRNRARAALAVLS